MNDPRGQQPLKDWRFKPSVSHSGTENAPMVGGPKRAAAAKALQRLRAQGDVTDTHGAILRRLKGGANPGAEAGGYK